MTGQNLKRGELEDYCDVINAYFCDKINLEEAEKRLDDIESKWKTIIHLEQIPVSSEDEI